MYTCIILSQEDLYPKENFPDFTQTWDGSLFCSDIHCFISSPRNPIVGVRADLPDEVLGFRGLLDLYNLPEYVSNIAIS